MSNQNLYPVIHLMAPRNMSFREDILLWQMGTGKEKIWAELLVWGYRETT